MIRVASLGKKASYLSHLVDFNVLQYFKNISGRKRLIGELEGATHIIFYKGAFVYAVRQMTAVDEMLVKS